MNGLQIRSKRKDLGLTQKELAHYLGVSLNTIINWEKGTVIPKSKIGAIEAFFENFKANVEGKKLLFQEHNALVLYIMTHEKELLKNPLFEKYIEHKKKEGVNEYLTDIVKKNNFNN